MSDKPTRKDLEENLQSALDTISAMRSTLEQQEQKKKELMQINKALESRLRYYENRKSRSSARSSFFIPG